MLVLEQVCAHLEPIANAVYVPGQLLVKDAASIPAE